MYINELGVQEVNNYYARKRSVNLSPNACSFAERLQKAAENSRVEESTKIDASDASDPAVSEETCCEKCALNNKLAALNVQLMKQMMSQSIYSQGGLGLLPMGTGTGALSAYQTMMKLFGSGLSS